MPEFQDQVFRLKTNRGDWVCEDLSLRNCTFDNCRLSLTNDPAHMARVARVSAVDCYSLNSTIGPAYLEDIVVDGMKTGDIFIVWGAFLRHVTLRGKIGSLKINTSIHDPRAARETQAEFDRLRREFYSNIDWALDISGMKPLMFDMKGIPAAKVILDPKTQIAVSRKRLHDLQQLESLPNLESVLKFTLQMFINGAESDIVLAAPTGKAPKQYKPILDSFEMLREAGLAGID